MYDKKMSRVFLKRIECPSLRLSELFVGSKATIFSRVILVKEYGDIATASKQQVERESTFAMIKPDSYTNVGKIIDAV
jgi:nucleoside-diphosphate kinase